MTTLGHGIKDLRQISTRCATLGLLFFQHPTWARAHVQNYIDRRSDRKLGSSTPPAANSSLLDALGRITNTEASDIEQLLLQLPEPEMHRASVLYGNPIASNALAGLLYVCCRLLKPQTVLETGVATGYSTAVILKALAENEKGILLSIDLPHLHPRASESVGAAVDPNLRQRWELHFGPAEQLIATVGDGDQIDIFVQDASHWVRGQLAEYRAGWARLRDGGILISDDVGRGFSVFADEVGQDPIFLVQDPKPAPIGILIKGRPASSTA